ncbi:MAG: amino acid adenylation domain-containing protein, partial [candidate division KSB1 bacterium]|nr:amino acid adenylation domain-containing protein [candidate division KSB1 bacterium]MDZ7299887.1 amino acid adenylation domain-containing protein [candidate division KSB1 bacterium]MDZ7350786.1 amino acid adenylation domain-containing protein [candidate division KSB1 bacterium]MDZ7355254.1 amino acid adenylation domain-containing protein [candidate division KSB1 bacterium]MDZ7397347.1 amino acid adenylation domain-containing protein [candidate division KSB1 bacterium]
MSKLDLEAVYPLSPMQHGMLFHSLYAPESGVYIEQLSCTLLGDLHPTAFVQAWQQVMDRQPVLRTAFAWKSTEKPMQVVHRRLPVPFTQLDWRDLPAAQQSAQFEAFLQADRGRGFDLARAPLMRLTLLRLDTEVYKLVWTHHHLLFDGWSMPILFKEVLTFYEALRSGRTAILPPARPFRDYITWLNQQDLSAAGKFWRHTLQGFTAPTPLVVDRARPTAAMNGESDYRKESLLLSDELSRQLQALARQHQLTLNTLLQAAWALVLHRYSGEADIVFGTTVSGRPTEIAGVENMVGLFINTLPLRVRLASDPPVLALLGQIQHHAAEMRQFEYSPLVQVQSWSEVPAGTPLFDSILVFENYPADTALARRREDGGLAIQDIRSFERTNYPLTFVSGPRRPMALELAYDARRFDRDTIQRLLGHVQMLLHGMAADPRQPISRLPLLTPPETHRLLIEWNDTAADSRIDQCIHQWFECEVEKHPGAVAVEFEGARLTYRELNQRANQLARHLRQLGVGPETLVALCFERSLEMVIAMLGILKAGGAFVPIDPNYPAERVKFMLADARPAVLLTQKHLAEKLPATTAQVIGLEAEWEKIARQPATNLSNATHPGNLAYVIYTSGSTGRPKGVLLHHRGLHNLVQAQIRDWGFDEKSRVLQFASLSFDAAVSEIFCALLSGGLLYVTRQETLMSLTDLHRCLQEQHLSAVTLPPSVLAMLSHENLPALRTVISAGEPCTWELAARWSAGRQLFNAYGPTEGTIAACWQLVEGREADRDTVPIGRPFANVQLYVLDARLRPVPIGVPGELHIGGAGVARGYLNRPDLTAEKFIPHPFSRELGARLYKSGDLARWRPDGRLEFLGRLDQQVKVRGFRIEPGEIEACLKQHPAVREAVVVARAEAPNERQLVAYLVPQAGHALHPGELQNFLQTHLPGYMVPAAFVALESMPLLPNGKIDRRRLPAPEGSRLVSDKEFLAPRTVTEELLATLWQSLLRVPRVGGHDSFFELGGHSLLATQLVSRIREAFHVELPIRRLFELRTLAALAVEIDRLRNDAAATVAAPPLQPVARSGELPLSFAQQRLWFLDQLQPGAAFYNIPVALRLHGRLDTAALEKSLQRVIARHESLRTTFASRDGRPVQVIAPTLQFRLPLIALENWPESARAAEVLRLSREEALQPFDLVHGPLLRARLLRLAAEEHVLLLTLHHIIADGWSMGVLVREVAQTYTAALAGKEPGLPELPIQYADYAAWQRQWLSGEVLQKQLAFWKEQLAGHTEVLELPTDRPRPPLQTFHGAVEKVTFAPELLHSLQTLSQREGVTLFMTLLAAFQTLLHRYTGQPDILVGSPIANRTRAETENLIGFFVNTLVLRADFSGNPTFRELLRQVRERCLGAYAHQDLPFEKLVEELQPVRDLSRSPLFQVAFILQNAPMQKLELPGLTLSPLETAATTAKYDLTLTMAEGQDGLHAWAEYNTDLFNAETITRLLGHFETLLQGIAREAEQRVSYLPLLPA